MQIVVDIDEEVYKDAMNDIPNGLCKYSNEAIRNGIPLPEGHGDLIDRDKLSHIYRQMSFCSTAPNFIWVSELMKVTPVVEADKSEVD